MKNLKNYVRPKIEIDYNKDEKLSFNVTNIIECSDLELTDLYNICSKLFLLQDFIESNQQTKSDEELLYATSIVKNSVRLLLQEFHGIYQKRSQRQ